MFNPVDSKQSLPKMEEKILKFWEEQKIFQKSVEKNSAEKLFVFYEGPPTANGQPGLHHVLARAFKDIIPRYKTMKGFRVERKAGWDTHGLPVEIQVEKELKIHSKPQIENIIPGNVRESIIEFNKKCKESVWKYKDAWEKMTQRMAYWVDLKNPYITYDNKYIESVWWQFAQIFSIKNKAGESIVYQGSKVIPYCYRCGTGLSSHEVAQGYQKVKDNSVYVKFKAKKDGKIITDNNTYFLVWTTTPWTLPGNIALAVGKGMEYVRVRYNDEQGESKFYILVKSTYEVRKNELFPSVKKLKSNETPPASPEILETIKSDDLMGLEYEPLYETNNTERKAYFIILGDFVSTEEGTGIVHIAPAFGEDDANVARENNLPTLITVDEEGKISAEVPGKGIPVKKKNSKNRYEADSLIVDDLQKRGLLFKEEIFEHDYPHCWRCDMPLIYYAKPSWFIRMSELRSELVENNGKVNWIPAYIKDGRFGEWLRDAKDWAISRERYWGTPLPIWICEKCGEQKVFGSIAELEKLSGKKIGDLHKPFIDEITFPCEKCQGKMQRTSEVLDVWFDSGAMPLAQFNYPSSATEEDKEKIESGKYFPADYISEAIDQTRGWFYTLHAIATLLNFSGKTTDGNAYKNVICLGHILDSQGKKMSKSRGNVIEPMKVMNEYGADALRWMLYSINQPGLPKRFDLKGMRDVTNRVFRMLWNSYYFFVMYANIDKYKVSNIKNKVSKDDNLLDRWVVSEMNTLIKTVDEKLEKYDVYGSTKLIENFIDNLSNWYIRRSRKRFWKSENDEDKKQAYETLHYVLVELSKLIAPFTPFVAEEVFKNLTKEESVHLADFPKYDKELIDSELNDQMRMVRKFVRLGLAARAKAGIKVRQPLLELFINEIVNDKLADLIKDEVNVKDVKFVGSVEQMPGIYTEVEGNSMLGLNIVISEELRLEGEARELIRQIQELRKKAGFEVDNRISICYEGGKNLFDKFGDMIMRETLAVGIWESEDPKAQISEMLDLETQPIKVWLKRV
jgi:isoleucyl-tRNA synthetase